MKSKYDNIKTARELVAEVALNGISTTDEDICRAQDIFGQSSVGELKELAKDFSGVHGKTVSCEFYHIISVIWAWEDAVRFWNETSNREHQEVQDLREEVDALGRKNDTYYKEIENLRVELKDAKNEVLEIQERQIDKDIQAEKEAAHARECDAAYAKAHADQIAALEEEIIRLKAKLYDYMEKVAELQ